MNETATEAPQGAANAGYNAELKISARMPRDVLRDTMHFYDTQAKDIIADIILKLKEQNGAVGSELAMMYKRFHECTDIAIRCAEKLAPYEHPKLESIEVKKELTHRFVLRAPAAVVDTGAWLENAQKEQKILSAKAGHDVMKAMPTKPKIDYKGATILVPNCSVPDDFEDDDSYEFPEDDE